MTRGNIKRIIVPGVSIWPQPKTNRRARYKLTFKANGRRVTIRATTDIVSTQELAQQIANINERVRVGLLSDDAARYAREDNRPTSDHLDEYRDAMVSAGKDPKHAAQMCRYARAVLLGTPPAPVKRGRGSVAVKLDGAGASRVSAIVASLVQREIGRVKAARSAATANRYLDAVNGFLNWGVKDRRWERNVVAHLEKHNAAADRRVTRRVIPVELVSLLIDKTESGKFRQGVGGKERALIYRVCVATGLRANEIRRTLVRDLALSAEVPGVWVQAKHAKNRKRSFIAVPKPIAELIADHVKLRAADAPAFRVPHNTARMLRYDLQQADIPYKVNGEVFDFHALRHECGAILISAGANPKAVQQHMRHGSIKLTLDTYGHVMDRDRQAMLSMVPTFESARRAARRAGGSDSPSESSSVGGEVQTTAENQWSHGESNPDLLNAIQPRTRSSTGHRALPERDLKTSLPPVSAGSAAQMQARRRYFTFAGRVMLRLPRPVRIPRRAMQVRKLVAAAAGGAR